MTNMLWSRPPASPRKSSDLKEKGDLMWRGSVGRELDHLAKERAIQTDPEETRRRRTIQLVRKDPVSGSWGFTLQTYGIRDKKSKHVEVMTYVDYVELHGPAWIAGMRKGDVLLSVNGESVEGFNHPSLVARIKLSKEKLRLVVLFEDCCRKVELYERYIKLKRILSQKMRDLRQLEHEEKILSSGGQLSRLGLFRDSLRSSTSSDWDCYSEIASPSILESEPVNQRMWRQRFFSSSVDTLDTRSHLSLQFPSTFGSSKESLDRLPEERGASFHGKSASFRENSASFRENSASFREDSASFREDSSLEDSGSGEYRKIVVKEGVGSKTLLKEQFSLEDSGSGEHKKKAVKNGGVPSFERNSSLEDSGNGAHRRRAAKNGVGSKTSLKEQFSLEDSGSIDHRKKAQKSREASNLSLQENSSLQGDTSFIEDSSVEDSSVKENSSSLEDSGSSFEHTQKASSKNGESADSSLSSSPAKGKFYVDSDAEGSDSEGVATLRRPPPAADLPYPGCRKRSNSTLLNEMRMQLIADAVQTQADEAAAEREQEEEEEEEEEGGSDGEFDDEDESGAVSESEVTIELEDVEEEESGEKEEEEREEEEREEEEEKERGEEVEEVLPCRLYKGVRINDSDADTRL